MLYKPNFCCNCGEKIQRAEWNLLTSRRFCEVCSVENRKHDHLPRIIAAAGLLSLAFGIGSFFGSGGSSDRQVRGFKGSLASEETGRPRQKAPTNPDLVPDDQDTAALPAPVSEKDEPSITAPAETFAVRKPSEPAKAYFCGARTKKGTPCSRRVKQRGERCWQHRNPPPDFPEN